MTSSCAPVDTGLVRCARDDIVSAYASTVAASSELTGGRAVRARHPGAETLGGLERLTTRVGTAGVMPGTSWDGPRPRQGHGT